MGAPHKSSLKASSPDVPAKAQLTSQATSCPIYEPRERFGRIKNKALTEASGLVASDQNPDVLWSHNDSGAQAVVYAMTAQGKHLGAFQLFGVEAVDWEDIAIGPGPDL